MQITGIVTGIIYILTLFGLPFFLIRKKWSSLAIAYLVAAICSFLAIITGNQIFAGVISFPEPGEFLRTWLSQTLITGIVLFLILVFFRNVFFKFPLMDALKKDESKQTKS